MKKIPYGISDYEDLIRENYYYVDKTQYIEKLENLSAKYLFFLRPRRFGKSLFISMLENYYDINKKDDFDALFGNTYIGKNPTPLRNSYTILRLNFSQVKSNGPLDEIEESFRLHILSSIRIYLGKNKNFNNVSNIDYDEIKKIKNGGDILEYFIAELNTKNIKYFLLIDEYDNFANNILMELGQETYTRVTHSGGFLRTFFAVIKSGTETGTIHRLFVTGVSPVVLADVTSGFNMGDNISNNAFTNEMIGFTTEETETILEHYIQSGLIPDNEREKITQIMKEYYNNYCFWGKTHKKVYNSDMVLYFLNNYLENNEIPDNLIDDNVRTDYGKLRYLILSGKKLNGNFNILTTILETGITTGELVTSFAIGERIEETRFRSLLYYLGLLTIDKHIIAKDHDFIVPNKVIETLLWNYIREALKDSYDLKINIDHLKKCFRAIALNGEWKELFEYIIERFYDACSNRDFVYHEEGIKMFLLAYLSLTPYHLVHSEPEMNGGFADIWLSKNSLITDLTKHEYLIELKYMKSGEKDVDTAFAGAQEQLLRYMKDKKIFGDITKIVIVVNSREILRMEEIFQ